MAGPVQGAGASAAPTISYAVTVCDELAELQRLVAILRQHAGGGDEIVVQYDAPRATPAILAYLQGLDGAARILSFDLAGDFAAFKNHLKDHCRGDYLFQIDADEYPSEHLLSRLRDLLTENPAVDILLVPRVNIVRGLTPEHVREWGWHVNAQGWVNFPDPQSRIWRNRQEIRWRGRVHERLVGGQVHAALPARAEFSLIHDKDIARQERQNRFYQTLGEGG